MTIAVIDPVSKLALVLCRTPYGGKMNRLRLLVLYAALGPLDYRLPEGTRAPPGSVVIAPLGPRKVTGIVWDEGRLPGDEIAFERLRPILEVLPVPPLPEPLRRLIEWTADYYCAPLASVARMAAMVSRLAVSVVRSITSSAAIEPIDGASGRLSDVSNENWPLVRPSGDKASSKRRATGSNSLGRDGSAMVVPGLRSA